MKTNREKFNYYVSLVIARGDEYIRSLFPEGLLMKEVYQPSSSGCGKMEVTGAHYVFPPLFHHKRITKADVKAARKLFAEVGRPDFVFEKEQVNLELKVSQIMSLRTYRRLSEVDGKRLAWTAEELEPEIQRLKELYEPREGHTACRYCARQCPTEKMFRGTIISRMWKNKGFTSPERLYCSQECHSHDQMAHEG